LEKFDRKKFVPAQNILVIFPLKSLFIFGKMLIVSRDYSHEASWLIIYRQWKKPLKSRQYKIVWGFATPDVGAFLLITGLLEMRQSIKKYK